MNSGENDKEGYREYKSANAQRRRRKAGQSEEAETFATEPFGNLLHFALWTHKSEIELNQGFLFKIREKIWTCEKCSDKRDYESLWFGGRPTQKWPVNLAFVKKD